MGHYKIFYPPCDYKTRILSVEERKYKCHREEGKQKPTVLNLAWKYQYELTMYYIFLCVFIFVCKCVRVHACIFSSDQ